MDVIAPVLALETVCLIAISTLGKAATNFFTRLIKSPKFYSYSFSYVCAKCKNKSVKTQCIHNLDNIPHWSSEGRLALIKEVIGDGESERYEREALGVISEENGMQCFTEDKVMQFITRPRSRLSRPVPFFIFCVDPVAGSEVAEKRGSDMALVSLCGPSATLLGMELLDVTRPEHYQTILVEHIRRIRLMPMCMDATIVLDVESGTGLEAGHIQTLVRKNFNNVVVMNDFHRKPGTQTTEATKLQIMELTNEFLHSGEAYICDQFVTSNKDPEKIIATLRDQLLNYTKTVKPSTGVNTAGHVRLTGKDGGQMDDAALTFQRAINAKCTFMHSDKYTNDRR